MGGRENGVLQNQGACIIQWQIVLFAESRYNDHFINH